MYKSKDEQDKDILLADSMVCYCEAQTSGGLQPGSATNVEFYDVDKDAEPDSIPNYCRNYLSQLVKKQAIE